MRTDIEVVNQYKQTNNMRLAMDELTCRMSDPVKQRIGIVSWPRFVFACVVTVALGYFLVNVARAVWRIL